MSGTSPVLSNRGLVPPSDDNPLATVQKRPPKPNRASSHLHLKKHPDDSIQDPSRATSQASASAEPSSSPVPSSSSTSSPLVAVPAAGSNETKNMSPSSEPQHVNPRTDLLLVEDVRVSQRVARVALSRARFRVDVAGDGVEAVEMYKAKNYDIILMDIMLPRLTGDEATRQIREIEKAEKRVPVIIFGCTGSLSNSDLESYKAAGMNGVIGKGSILESAVPEALAEHESRPNEFIVCKMSVMSNQSNPMPSPQVGVGRALSSRADAAASVASSTPANPSRRGMAGVTLSSRVSSVSAIPTTPSGSASAAPSNSVAPPASGAASASAAASHPVA